ncbi:MAG: hypothetical protein WCC48_17980 [Anaeromyxobacteraceae bacterium]
MTYLQRPTIISKGKGGIAMTFKQAVRVLLLTGLLVPAGATFADDWFTFNSHRGADRSDSNSHRQGNGKGHSRDDEGGVLRSIPEFDAASVGTVAALLMGGGILAARRRRVP